MPTISHKLDGQFIQQPSPTEAPGFDTHLGKQAAPACALARSCHPLRGHNPHRSTKRYSATQNRSE